MQNGSPTAFAIEIKMGGEQINPLMLVGILEQVQLNILDGLSTSTEEQIQIVTTTKPVLMITIIQ